MMVYFSDSINELGATHWKCFSKQQYFDSKGLFISVVFSMPILFCCMVLIVSSNRKIIIAVKFIIFFYKLQGTWLWQSTQLLSKLKIAQLKQQKKLQANTNIANSDSKKYD
jgi:transmembrane protein 18